MYRIVLILLLPFIILFNSPLAGSPVTIKLGTATKAGNYYQLGQNIKQLFENDSGLTIKVVETQGSVDNIFKLRRNEIDLAIIQNDIAFAAENGVSPFKEQISDLTGVLTFYSEPIYLVTNASQINYLNQLANHKVNVGPLGSGLLTDSKIILNSAGLWDLVLKQHHKPAEVLDLLLRNKIHASFVNNISPDVYKEIKNGKLFVISLSNNLIESLTKTYPYFKSHKVELLSDEVTTIAVKSILIAKKNIDAGFIYTITKRLSQNFVNLNFPTKDISPDKTEIIHYMPLKNWHAGSEKYFIETGVMTSNTFLKYLWIILIIFFSFILIIFILNIIFFSFNKKKLQAIGINSRVLNVLKNINLKIFQFKYVVVILIVLTAFVSNIFIVQHFEHDWAIKNNIISNFDNRPFIRNVLWMFVFGGSGYEDNLFPRSPMGKFFATLIPLIGFGGIITIIGLLTSDHIKRRMKEARGVMSKKIKNHIILCGWNENVPFLVRNLLHKNIINKKPIIILANMEEDLPLDKYKLDHDWVSFVRGDATNKEDLDRANLKDADIAIIVADSDTSDPDAKNILKILTIEKYGHELELAGKRKNRENIYTIAEIQDADKSEAAYDAYVDEIVSFGHIKSKIFVQSILNPGVSKFLNEILTYNDFNDIYSIRIKQKSNLIGQTFDDLLEKLRRHKILLLSISLENHRSKEEVRNIMAEYNLKRGVITNPISEEEINYKTQPGDILIVLAQYEKDVTRALKKIEALKEF